MGAQLFFGHHSQPNPGAQVGRGHEDQDARAKNKGKSLKKNGIVSKNPCIHSSHLYFFMSQIL